MTRRLVLLLILGLLLTACGATVTASPGNTADENAGIQPTTTQNAPQPAANTATATTTQPTVAAAGATADCPTANFQDVQAHPANSAYPAPELTVTCTEDSVVIHTNNIPNFEFISITPNELQAQDITITLPRNPTPAAQVTNVPLGGASAITVNGLVIFGPTEAPQTGYRDPYLDQILDYCNGHTAPGGVYHFHARPDCIYAEIDGQVGLVLGYAFDGYPILAPYICADSTCTSVKEVQSSWEMQNPDESNAWEQHVYVPGLSELDQCNGLAFADGSYAYFATDTFPYFMGCYHGTVTQQAAGGGNNPPQGGTLPQGTLPNQGGQSPQSGGPLQGGAPPPGGLPPQGGAPRRNG